MAAENGDSNALTALIMTLSNLKDQTLLINLLRNSAEDGNAEVQTALGIAYAKSEGASQNYKEAAKWLRKAADNNNAEAQTFLGLMYAECKIWGQSLNLESSHFTDDLTHC
jgi:hypothetical protein